MNWDRAVGRLMQTRGWIRERWGRMLHDPLAVHAGRRDRIIGEVQERCGLALDGALRDAARREARSRDQVLRHRKSRA